MEITHPVGQTAPALLEESLAGDKPLCPLHSLMGARDTRAPARVPIPYCTGTCSHPSLTVPISSCPSAGCGHHHRGNVLTASSSPSALLLPPAGTAFPHSFSPSLRKTMASQALC